MKSYLFILLTLMLMVLMSCDNPFERIQNDIDAIKSIRNIEESIENLNKKIEKFSSSDENPSDSDIKEILNDINNNLNIILKSDAVVSLIRDDYKSKIEGDSLTTDIKALKQNVPISYTNSIIMFDDILNKLSSHGIN